MDGHNFDEFTRALVRPHSRRRVLGFAAALLTFGGTIRPRDASAAICAERVPKRTRRVVPEGCGATTATEDVRNALGRRNVDRACNILQTCYYTCNRDREACHTKFRTALFARCGKLKNPSTRLSCGIQADFFYAAATAGKQAYEEAQAEVCHCCIEGKVACKRVCCASGHCVDGKCTG